MKKMDDDIKACSTKPAYQTERGWERTYVFPAAFCGFQGHFPQNPVLPAIVQLMTARHSIAEKVGQDLLITKVTRAKFQKVITPDIPVTVIWTLRQQEDAFLCKCVLETEGSSASSFNLTLQAESH